MDAALDYSTPPTPPSATPAATTSAPSRATKILDMLFYVSAALLALAAIVYVRLLRAVHFTAFSGAAMYSDLIYVAGIALLGAITLLLTLACLRLQSRK